MLREPIDPSWPLTTWNDLFHAEMAFEGKCQPVIDSIVSMHDESVKKSLTTIGPQHIFPQAWNRDFSIGNSATDTKAIQLRLGGRWKTWSARMEAYLLDGTYSITDGRFVGSQATPFVDTHSFEPGPGWTPLESAKLPNHASCQFVITGKAKEALLSAFASKPLICE